MEGQSSAAFVQEVLGEVLNTERTDYGAKFRQMRNDSDALMTHDRVNLDLRKEVLDADMEYVRNMVKHESIDFARAVEALEKYADELGADYTTLTQLNDVEKAIITRTKERVEQWRLAVARAQQNYETAGNDLWFKNWFNRLENAKAEANRDLQRVKGQIDDPEALIAEAELQAKQKARERLLDAPIQETALTFRHMSDEVTRIMDARVVSLNEQFAIIAQEREVNLDNKAKASLALEKLRANVAQAEKDLADIQEKKLGYGPTDPEYDELEAEEGAAKALLSELTGRRNKTLVLYQSTERFALELAIDEEALIGLRDNIEALSTGLKYDTDIRVKAFEAYAEGMKGMADQQISSRVDRVGIHADKRRTAGMAAAITASNRLMEEKLAAHAGDMEEFNEVNFALVESLQRTQARHHEIAQQILNNYGLDAKRGWLSTYAKPEEPSAAGAGQPSASDVKSAVDDILNY